MPFYKIEDRETKELSEGINARTFWGQNLLLAVVDLDANIELPNHSHPHEQGGIVIEGQLELTINGETRILKPSNVYIIPGGVEHSARTGPQPTRVMDIFSPVREEYKY
jgi:quercetin dioxygenase-like cupin family protein